MSEAARQYSLLNASTTESYESELSMKVSCVTGDGVSYFCCVVHAIRFGEGGVKISALADVPLPALYTFVITWII